MPMKSCDTWEWAWSLFEKRENSFPSSDVDMRERWDASDFSPELQRCLPDMNKDAWTKFGLNRSERRHLSTASPHRRHNEQELPSGSSLAANPTQKSLVQIWATFNSAPTTFASRGCSGGQATPAVIRNPSVVNRSLLQRGGSHAVYSRFSKLAETDCATC